MDRIVLRIPSNSRRNISTYSLVTSSVGAVSILVACGPFVASNVVHITVDLVALSLIVYIISIFLRRMKMRLKEAVIEITPFGVQLVSVYGSSVESPTTTKCNDVVRIRSFIPNAKIIDVIVMEVVWPHCVWSQLAFRVVKSSSGAQGIVTSPPDKKIEHLQFHNKHTLLEQNRVSIIPCFPDECRGLLTYKQCLDVQNEIERILGIRDDR
jgi:hypothetical protein